MRGLTPESDPASRTGDATHGDARRPCGSCGYDLRGLPAVRPCPECGAAPGERTGGDPRRGSLVDVLLEANDDERRRWRRGLDLALVCLIAAMAIPLLHRLVLFVETSRTPLDLYAGSHVVLGIAWAVACAMLLPGSLETTWPWTRRWRLPAVLSQWCWPAAFAIWSLVRLESDAAPILPAAFVLGLGGLAGLSLCAVMWRFLAEEAELVEAARLLNNASWVLPLTTPLMVAFAASVHLPGMVPLDPMGVVLMLARLIPIALIGLWVFTMGRLVGGLRRLRSHLVWGERLEARSAEREQRIAATRAELDEQNTARVRPLRTAAADIPLDSPADRSGSTP